MDVAPIKRISVFSAVGWLAFLVIFDLLNYFYDVDQEIYALVFICFVGIAISSVLISVSTSIDRYINGDNGYPLVILLLNISNDVVVALIDSVYIFICLLWYIIAVISRDLCIFTQALYVSIRRVYYKCIWNKEYHAATQLLINGIINHQNDIVIESLKSGALVNNCDYEGRTPLMIALLAQNRSVIDILLRYTELQIGVVFPNINIYSMDIYGNTCVSICCDSNNISMLNKIIHYQESLWENSWVYYPQSISHGEIMPIPSPDCHVIGNNTNLQDNQDVDENERKEEEKEEEQDSNSNNSNNEYSP